MKLLREVNELTRLSHTQMVVLVSMYAAPTPELAFDTSIGAENTVEARVFLQKLGYILAGDGKAEVTERGKAALLSYNLIDDMGEVTEEGKGLQEHLPKDKEEFTESFKFIQSL